MSDPAARREWCDRLADAILEGRFFEDPAAWRSHVQSCKDCRNRVEGLYHLRELITAADEESAQSRVSPEDSRRIFDEARRRYRNRQRLRGLGTGALLLVLGLIGLLWHRSQGSELPSDAVAYAARLHDLVFPPHGAPPNYSLLQENAALREEYLRALDHPSSLVRRTALVALTGNGVPVSPARLEGTLREWREDLERPIDVAGADSEERRVAEALERRRTATVQAVFLAILDLAGRGEKTVRPAVIEDFLLDADASTRNMALRALAQHPEFVPGRKVVEIMERDGDDAVRSSAAYCLIHRLGNPGIETVLRHVHDHADVAVEATLLPFLPMVPEGLAFSRARVAEADCPITLALAHLDHLLQVDPAFDGSAVLARALRSPVPEVTGRLAALAAKHGLLALREPLQERWRSLSGMGRSAVGRPLVLWDCRRGGEKALALATEICKSIEHPALRSDLRQLERDSDAALAARASRLLEAMGDR